MSAIIHLLAGLHPDPLREVKRFQLLAVAGGRGAAEEWRGKREVGEA